MKIEKKEQQKNRADAEERAVRMQGKNRRRVRMQRKDQGGYREEGIA